MGTVPHDGRRSRQRAGLSGCAPTATWACSAYPTASTICSSTIRRSIDTPTLAIGEQGSDTETNTLVPEQALEKVLSLAIHRREARTVSVDLPGPPIRGIRGQRRSRVSRIRAATGVPLYPLAREL
jgi:hypothetical protein